MNDFAAKLDEDASREGCVDLPPQPGRLLSEIHVETPDPNELLKDRFLCRKGGLLLVAPTGVGKSSFVMQCAVQWGANVPAFGIEPLASLSSWVVQAENDDGDLFEEKEGIAAGLTDDAVLSREQIEEAMLRVRVVDDVTACGDEFGQWLWRNLDAAKQRDDLPDLLVVDPVFSFLGGDSLFQKDVSHFLRNTLNPVLRRFNIACILVHHTNKPSNLKEKNTIAYQGDLAYLGAGSAEWGNWARAVLALRKTARPHLFKLHVAKRGKRLKWTDDSGSRAYERLIAHARQDDHIYWRAPDSDEIESLDKAEDSPTAKHVESDELLRLAGKPLPKAHLLDAVRERFDVGRDKANAAIRPMIRNGRLVEVTVSVDPHYKLIGPPLAVTEAKNRIEAEYRASSQRA